MIDLDRRFTRIEQGIYNPEQKATTGLAERIQVARERERARGERPAWMATEAGIKARSRALREALRQPRPF